MAARTCAHWKERCVARWNRSSLGKAALGLSGFALHLPTNETINVIALTR